MLTSDPGTQSGASDHEHRAAYRDALRIGAVSRLTGLSAHTLRKWEARYGAAEPRRTGRGERLYTHEDVQRLALLKRLVDMGVAPREVAHLSLDALERNAERFAQAAGADGSGPLRVAVVGTVVAAMVANVEPASSAIEVVVDADDASKVGSPMVDTPIDILIIECAMVEHTTRATVEALRTCIGARVAVVVYRFGTRGDLLALQAPHIATLRAPADPRTLHQVALELVRPGRRIDRQHDGPGRPVRGAEDPPPPRLSRDLLARIARSTPQMQCECPHHLADIVLGLRAFEDYSAACESRNTEDAAMHRYLWRSAGQARAMFEDAIERVAALEGIPLDERDRRRPAPSRG